MYIDLTSPPASVHKNCQKMRQCLHQVDLILEK
jgi:hypothetical protein